MYYQALQSKTEECTKLSLEIADLQTKALSVSTTIAGPKSNTLPDDDVGAVPLAEIDLTVDDDEGEEEESNADAFDQGDNGLVDYLPESAVEFNQSEDTILELVFESLADPILVLLSSFRKFIKEANILDSRVVAGDIDVAFATSLKKSEKKRTKEDATTLAADAKKYRMNNENKLNLEQFGYALTFLASKKYKNDESDLWNESVDDSYSANKEKSYLSRLIAACIKPWGIHKGILTNEKASANDLNSEDLRRVEVISLFNRERPALQSIFDHYNKRSHNTMSSSHPDAYHLLDYSELLIFAREYNITPKLCTASRLAELFRVIRKNNTAGISVNVPTRRSSTLTFKIGVSSSMDETASETPDVDGTPNRRSSSRMSKIDGSRVPTVLADNGGAEALTYSQFLELLGHIALESFTDKNHRLPEQRVLSLMKWLDASKGRDKMAARRSSTVVRFGSRTGFK
jgi:hypothetical protein